ncbi:MAG: 6-phosphogluconolactonase [Actinobacteria bacterium]|nr:6-phosphogluconolactonase [Actinomycetota bacterium]
MTAELVVTDDLPGEAVRRFLEIAPRTIALSGGGTPRPFYEALARAPYGWDGVHAFMVDERCVAQTHPDSNFRMASEALLARVPVVVHPMRASACVAEAYEADLRAHFGDVEVPRIDLCVMGIGDDGHTASLFPGDPVLEERERWVARVDEPGMEPLHPRLTLTLPVLNAAGCALFLVSGESKREPLARMLGGDLRIPATRVWPERLMVLATPDAVPMP